MKGRPLYAGGPFSISGQADILPGMKIIILLFTLATGACGRHDRPQPPTAEESARLDDAEDMLDELANETGPENAEAPSGPANRSDNSSGR